MKKLILDYSIWRSGGNGPYRVGLGLTFLLNPAGFECCLGQFSRQLHMDVKDSDLRHNGNPAETGLLIPILTHMRRGKCVSTSLADYAIQINDDENMTTVERIALLRVAFEAVGYEIEVINAPEGIK